MTIGAAFGLTGRPGSAGMAAAVAAAKCARGSWLALHSQCRPTTRERRLRRAQLVGLELQGLNHRVTTASEGKGEPNPHLQPLSGSCGKDPPGDDLGEPARADQEEAPAADTQKAERTISKSKPATGKNSWKAASPRLRIIAARTASGTLRTERSAEAEGAEEPAGLRSKEAPLASRPCSSV